MNVPRRSFLTSAFGLLGFTNILAAQDQRPKLVDGHCPVCSMKGEQEVQWLQAITRVPGAVMFSTPESPRFYLCNHCGCVFGENLAAGKQ
jgi:hypothetical protein